MKNARIQALNYCAHAIEDLRETETMLRDMAPESARVLRMLIDMLISSVKFIMPNCCELIDPDDLRQAHIDLVHLPYPCVAFEAPWEKETEGPEQIGGYKQTPATKRIALCWEALPEYEVLPGLYTILQDFPEGGVFIVPIFWGPETQKWMVTLGGAFVPYGKEVLSISLDKELPATRIATAALIEAGQVKPKSLRYHAEPFYLLPELYEQALSNYGSRSKTFAQIILDTRDEGMMLIQACSVINCANVTTTNIGVPDALNKKRQAKGKQPFFSYKILQLTGEQRASSGFGMDGQHASPRMHLRRGHLRRLESKKTVWVRPAMVNADSKHGAVLKDYAVEHKAKNN